MPLKKGKSKGVISENISELHSGATHARTAKKFGKKRADKQAVAIALSEARKAGHNPPKPHFATTGSHQSTKHKAGHDHELIAHANHRLPAHMRGKGIISSKALAIMGKKLAAEATPAVGTHVAKAGKSHAAKPDAKAAKPWKGQKLPGWASPEHGKQDAERAHADRERNRKGPTGKMSYSRRVAHNQPTPNYTASSQSGTGMPAENFAPTSREVSRIGTHANWGKFESEARPSTNIEDVRQKNYRPYVDKSTMSGQM